MTISIIGCGNVASVLARIFKQHQLEIVQIYARKLQQAQYLAAEVGAEAIDDLSQLNSKVDLVIFCLNDAAYENFLKDFPVSLNYAVHTAGSLPLTLLQPVAQNYGVFYPLNSLSKNQSTDHLQLTLCLEASNSCFKDILKNLSQLVQACPYDISSAQRQQIHLAAVFAQNFTNYMYTVAQDLLTKENIDIHIFDNLSRQHFEKLQQFPSCEIQTGPAVRQDFNIMEKHRQMLENHFSKEIYTLISQKIIDYYHSENY